MTMKKLGLLLIVFMIVGGFSACMKDSEPYDAQLQYGIDKELIETYNAANFPDATLHEVDGFGFWYQVIEPGVPGDYEYKIVEDGATPYIEAPLVQVKYTGKLLDGTIFDKNDDEEGVELPLNGLIPAWRIMFLPRTLNGEDIGGVLPYGLHPGAKVRFVTPSIFGYANTSQGTIPANSPLDFTVEVLDVLAPGNNPSN